jgi:hypothetical protein
VLTRTAMDRFAFAQVPLSQVKLRSRVAYQHASGQQRGVTEWDRASDAAADVLRLLAEVCEGLSPAAAARRRAEARANGQEMLDPGSCVAAANLAYDEPWSTSVAGLSGQAGGGLWSGFLAA